MMNINYNVDHRNWMVIDNLGEKMTSSQRLATWITLCQILHFSKYAANKSCEFKKSQMSKDFKIHPKFFGYATKVLIKHKLIKEIKPYDRKTQSSAIYQGDTGYIPLLQKLYPSETKAVSPGDRVNNYVNNYKPKNDDSTNVSSSSSKKEKSLSGLTMAEKQAKALELAKQNEAKMKKQKENKNIEQ